MASNNKKAKLKEHSPEQANTLPPHSSSTSPTNSTVDPDYSSMHNEINQIGQESTLEDLKDFYNIE